MTHRKEGMVYPDFSFSEHDKSESESLRIASVPDRVLAFLIDFLIFTPVVGLLTSGLLRELRTDLLLRSESSTSWGLWFSLISSWFILAVLAEALCIHYFKATPGQKFLKMEVRPIEGGAELDLGQSLARSVVHWLSFLCVLPMLAVYTHPRRRSLHDRAFDTVLVTRKLEGDPGPHPLERNFFHSWSRLMALVGVMILMSITARFREAMIDPSAQAQSPWCEDLEKSWQGVDRLDRAVGLFISGGISAACLEKEAQLVLWNGQGETRAFADLAKGLVSGDEETGKNHLRQVCESDDKSEACVIAQFSLSEDPKRADLLRKKGLGTFTARLLLVKESVEREQFASAAALIADLRQEALFDAYLAREEIRNIWKIQKQRSSREPASSELSEILKSFEERYEIQ